MDDKRNIGLRGYPPGGMDMIQAGFVQPMRGFPNNMMRAGGPHPPAGHIRQPMYPMQPGYMAPMPMTMMSRPPMAPPAYSPQMAQNFRARHRTPEQIREQQEQFRKQRQYEEQRIKLQNFGRVGPAGRSGTNADRMIESMFGKAERNKPKPLPANNLSTEKEDDGFGDFMAGPTNSPTQSAPPPTQSAPPPTQGAPSIGQSSTVSAAPGTVEQQLSDPSAAGGTGPENKTLTHNSQQRPEKDLMSMMMECSDLSAPKQAKHFHQKTVVKHVVPKQQVASVHHQSQRALNWGGTDIPTGLFQQQAVAMNPSSPHPTPGQPATATDSPPPWCQNVESLPPLYRQVEEAVTIEGNISTERLYPILLLSGLSREFLGHIWGLANRSTPGQLQSSELYMVLAMIALAQNNYSIPSLAILAQCPSPPIPYLGPSCQAPPPAQQVPANQQPAQAVSQGTVSSNSGITPPSATGTPQITNSAAGPACVPAAGSVVPTPSTSRPAVLPLSSTVQTTEKDQSDMEFADFQQGPSATTDDFGDFKAAEQMTNRADNKPNSLHSSPLKLEESLSPEDQHSNVTNFFCSDDSSSPTTPNSLDDYFFDEGKSVGSKISDSSQFSNSDMSEGEDFKKFDMYVEQFVGNPSPAKIRQSHHVHQQQQHQHQHQPNGGPGHKILGRALPWGNITRVKQPLPTVPVPKTTPPPPAQLSADDDFADFKEAPTPKSQPSELNLMGDENSEDKYAALRGWTDSSADIEPKSLLDADSSPVVVEETTLSEVKDGGAESQAQMEDDDWADFSEFTTAPASAFPSSKTTTIDYIPEPIKLDETDSHFPPPVKAAHTNSPFPPMAPSDLQADVFEQDTVFVGQPTADKKVDTPVTKKMVRKSTVQIKHSPVDKELQAVDFDISRVPPPMDFPEEAEDEFRDSHFGSSSPTLDPHSPTFEASFNQQHSLESNTLTSASPWSGLSNTQSNLFAKFGASAKTNTIIQYANEIPDSDKSDPHSRGQLKEDSQSVSSLEFSYVSRPAGRKMGDADSQSINSGEFGGFESAASKTTNPESKSVDSFDLQEEGLEYPQNLEGKQTNPESKSLDSLDLKKVDSREWSPDEGEEVSQPSTLQGDSSENEQTSDFGQLPVSAKALLQNGRLPALGDRYSGVIQEVQGSDRHVFEWERCLQSASHMINTANSVFNSISSSAVCGEILQCGPGTDFLIGVVEIYRVVCRISLAMKSAGISSDKLESELKSINMGWTNLTAFIATSPIMPDPPSLDYRIAILKSDDTASQLKACGVCLLNVDSRSKAFNEDKEGSKLTYGGRQYHTTCANFWVNCVNPMLPALRLPDLL